jgi:hypothetical protein
MKTRSVDEMQASPGRYARQLLRTLVNAQNDQKLGQNAHTLSTCPLLQLLVESDVMDQKKPKSVDKQIHLSVFESTHGSPN